MWEGGNAREEEKVMNNGSNRMVGGKRIKFGVKIHIRGLNPDAGAGRVRDFDIRMNLCDGDSQRGSSINDGMLAE